jgi:hypothetical protein
MELKSTPVIGNFYDGGVPAHDGQPEVPANRAEAPRILLDRRDERGVEDFALMRRIGYDDPQFGELLVPKELGDFHTDLTSVPAIFTWLVPKSGAHLPAALLHDGLVHERNKPTYTSVRGVVVDRIDADRVFRDAMRDTGTGVVRRWIVWAAVTTASLWSGGRWSWGPAQVWRYRAAIVATYATIGYLAYCATADLFDVHAWAAWQLPWMGERDWWLELLGGISGAIAIPMLLSVLWGRYFRAGVIGSVALATLIHVTIAVAAVALAYQGAEWLARKSAAAALAVAVLALAGAAALWLSLLITGR